MSLPPPIPLAEAQARLLAMAKPLGSETLDVAQAAGRFVAGQPIARRSQPAADLSAMDGYAMRADEHAGPWRIVGESAAGRPFSGQLGTGEAVRISTGAMLPKGAGTILIQENAILEGDWLRATGEASARHIRRAGFDFRTGDPLLEAGALLTPARLALLLTGGISRVEVGRCPSIAVLDSGDELSADPALCERHQTPASNGAMLAAMARPLASHTTRIGPVPDRMEALLAALEEGAAADVLVTSGGASVGDHDFIRPALQRWGATIDFWRIAIKPGKPLLVARRGRQIILGLPGNPVSAFVTSLLCVLPLLRRLGGSGAPVPPPLTMMLHGPLPATASRAEFIRARILAGGVSPLDEQDSSALMALSWADCLICRPPHAPTVDPGSTVEVLPLT